MTQSRGIPPLKTIRASQLEHMEFPETRWAVPNLIPEGLTIFAGRPKLGKSWLILNLLLSITTGRKALGQMPVEPQEALYLSLEDNGRRLQERMRLLLPEQRFPAGLHFATRLHRLDRGGMQQLQRFIADNPAIKTIVIDTFSKIRPLAGKGNSYDEDYDILGTLQQFAFKNHLAVVLIHHTRKSESENIIDEIAGSTGISAAADSILVLKKISGVMTLYATGRDYDSRELALHFNRETGGWFIMGDAETFQLSQERREILDILNEEDRPLSPQQVAAMLGKKPNPVRINLYRLNQEGFVKKTGYGKYMAITKSDALQTPSLAGGNNGGAPAPVSNKADTQSEIVTTGNSRNTGNTGNTGNSRNTGNTSEPKIPLTDLVAPDDSNEPTPLPTEPVHTDLFGHPVATPPGQNGGNGSNGSHIVPPEHRLDHPKCFTLERVTDVCWHARRAYESVLKRPFEQMPEDQPEFFKIIRSAYRFFIYDEKTGQLTDDRAGFARTFDQFFQTFQGSPP